MRTFFLVLMLACSAIFLFLPKDISAIQHGDLIITEIMENPDVVSDADGEWFEVYNNTDSPIDINGWIIKDDDRDNHVISNEGPLEIAAHRYFVFCANADSSQNGGFTCSYQYDYGSFQLANTGDEIVILENDIEIDRVNYNGDFPSPEGASIELKDLSLDNNIGSNWQEANLDFGQGDRGTPGSPNSSPPTPTPTPIEEPEETPEPEPEDTPTPTPTSTLVLTPTPTKKPTPTPTLTPTPTREILAEEATPAAEEATPTPTVLGEKTSNPVKFVPFVFIGLGSLLLLVSGGFILSPKLKMKYNYLRKSGEGEKII